jgi:hypothetical protein
MPEQVWQKLLLGLYSQTCTSIGIASLPLLTSACGNLQEAVDLFLEAKWQYSGSKSCKREAAAASVSGNNCHETEETLHI